MAVALSCLAHGALLRPPRPSPISVPPSANNLGTNAHKSSSTSSGAGRGRASFLFPAWCFQLQGDKHLYKPSQNNKQTRRQRLGGAQWRGQAGFGVWMRCRVGAFGSDGGKSGGSREGRGSGGGGVTSGMGWARAEKVGSQVREPGVYFRDAEVMPRVLEGQCLMGRMRLKTGDSGGWRGDSDLRPAQADCLFGSAWKDHSLQTVKREPS